MVGIFNFAYAKFGIDLVIQVKGPWLLDVDESIPLPKLYILVA